MPKRLTATLMALAMFTLLPFSAAHAAGGIYSHAPGPIMFGAQMLRDGNSDAIYVLQGSDPDDVEPTRGFFRFDISTGNWQTLAPVPSAVFIDASMLRRSGDDAIFLLPADGSASFYRYSITADAWSTLAPLPEPALNGASLSRDGSSDAIYALAGRGSSGFYRYSIATNSWTTLAPTPDVIGLGGSMSRDAGSDAIYALQGGGGTGWYRYSIAGNAWTSLAAVPGPVLHGTILLHDAGAGDYRVLEGDFLSGFFRYSVATNSWTTLADAPFLAYFGAFMIHQPGEDAVYTLQGWDSAADGPSTGFYRYSLSGDAWTPLASLPVGAYFGSYMIRHGADDAIFALPGNKSDALLRYTIAGNTWVGQPETTLDSSPPEVTTATSATFTFHATPAGGTFECSLDAAAYAPCPSPVTYTGLSLGLHDFRVRAKNEEGVIDTSASGFAWSVIAPTQDADGDGVLDSADDCPTLAGIADFHGCDSEVEVTVFGKPKSRVIVDAPIRVFDLSKGSCAAKIGIKPANEAKIFTTCPFLVETSTDGENKAYAGIEAKRRWLVIGFDPVEKVYASTEVRGRRENSVQARIRFKTKKHEHR